MRDMLLPPPAYSLIIATLMAAFVPEILELGRQYVAPLHNPLEVLITPRSGRCQRAAGEAATTTGRAKAIASLVLSRRVSI